MFRKRMIKGAIITVCVLSIQGCILNRDKNPHNDVLVFGTTTKFALDVSAPIQNGGVPEFTLGYKRLEAVWMPLKPNGEEDKKPNDETLDLIKKIKKCDSELKATITDQDKRNTFCLTAVLPSGKYVSVSSGIDQAKGGNNLEIDTYSVFASLGAKGTLGFNSASGNLAQFFATGVAAQRLGANQAVGMALNAKAPEAEVETAKVEKSKLELQIEKEKANADVYRDDISKGKLAAKTILGDKDQAVDSTKRQGLAKKIGGAGCDDTFLSGLDQTTVEKFIDDLNNQRFQCLARLGKNIDK